MGQSNNRCSCSDKTTAIIFKKTIMLLTVGVTVYNKEGRLEGLRSLLDICQSRRDVELLIVDDGSTDGSKRDIYTLFGDVARVVIHSDNQGVSTARNTLIRNARGRYITFIDADDYVDGNLLYKVVEEMDQASATQRLDVVLTRYKVIDISGRDISREAISSKGWIDKRSILQMIDAYLLKPNRDLHLVRCFAKVFRVSLLRESGCLFDTGLRNFEDVDFVAKVIRYVEGIRESDICFYKHQANALGKSETCSDTRSLVSHSGYIRATSTMLSTRDVLIRKLDANPLYSKSELRSQVVGAYTSIILVQGCARIKGLNELRRYRKEVAELISLRAIREAIDSYDYRRSGGSRLLTLLIRARLSTFVAIYAYIKYIRRYQGGWR